MSHAGVHCICTFDCAICVYNLIGHPPNEILASYAQKYFKYVSSSNSFIIGITPMHEGIGSLNHN